MMGQPVQRLSKLFHIGFNLEERVPKDHPLRRIDTAVDFSFVRPLVKHVYGPNGHVSLDPTLVLKLLFLCYYENLRSERELMRQLPLRLDWLWFCGLSIDDPIPDHSVLSKARKRWGEARFERIFEQVLRLCVQAGLVGGTIQHADSTLLKAHASLEKRVPRKLWQQWEAASEDPPQDPPQNPPQNPPADQDPAGPASPPPAAEKPVAEKQKPAPAKLNDRQVSPVDPDAAISTRKASGTILGYRDHRLVDDRAGIITATVATPADRDDGAMLRELLERLVHYTHAVPGEVVGDSMYGTQANYQRLKAAGIKAYLKKRRGKDSPKVAWLKLLPEGLWRDRALYLLKRRRIRAEGSFAEAHGRMNHRRCRWRGLKNVQIQCYLVAMVQNVKKLARQAPRGGVWGSLRATFGAGATLLHLLVPAFPPSMLSLRE
jgi:transposase